MEGVMAITVLTNAFLIDCTGKDPIDGAAVVIEGERIKDVIRSGKVGALKGKLETLDLKGRTLMPGLTDAHVHVCAVEGNIAEQHRYNPPSLIIAKAIKRIEQALLQGYTTVRDAGGADYGLREAVSSGVFPGPRMLVSGRVLSQTGGHGDKRRRSEWITPIECCPGMVGAIADGPEEVRRAAREEIRHDVDQIKIMASGGAMSPGDELDTTQYTVDEMRAAVDEARAVGKYVLAHAYSPSAVRNALQAGVRCIEHGNLIDETVAKEIKKAGAYLVPTMITYEAIWREGKGYGVTEHQLQKINMAREKSVEGLAHAYRAGCKIGSGSDLLGDMQAQRTVEFELKGQVMKPMEVLLSATRVNAEIFRMEKEIGSVEPGKYADLIAVKGNPLKDLRVFQNQDNLQLIMKGGVVYKRAL
jgi:imidazolonepropionase-like amidohydrolase